MVNRPAQGGGRTTIKYFLSIECFKMMGMQVSGERGNEIRHYFVNCEAELTRRLQEDEKQKHWKVIKACVLQGSERSQPAV